MWISAWWWTFSLPTGGRPSCLIRCARWAYSGVQRGAVARMPGPDTAVGSPSVSFFSPQPASSAVAHTARISTTARFMPHWIAGTTVAHGRSLAYTPRAMATRDEDDG